MLRRIAGMLLVALAGAGTMAPSASAAESSTTDVSVLFAVTGRDVTVTPLQGTSDYLVTIALPAEQVTWFTDRPERRAGTMSLTSFVDSWGAVGFRQDPPNAALDLTRARKATIVTATMVAPRIRRDGALVFRAIPLDGQPTRRHFDSVAAFVDPGDDGSVEGSTWPMPKFSFMINECIHIRLDVDTEPQPDCPD